MHDSVSSLNIVLDRCTCLLVNTNRHTTKIRDCVFASYCLLSSLIYVHYNVSKNIVISFDCLDN